MRGCGAALERQGGTLRCRRRHSFDIARSGYINLLQPQDRRSRHPGDLRVALDARRRLHDLGVTGLLVETMGAFATRADALLEAGCGDGFFLGTLAREIGFKGHGLDISTHAADLAARRYPECEWIVANADRFIPYANRTFSLVWSINARMNCAEFHRVLRPRGRLLIAIPAPDDLIELRGRGRDRIPRTVAMFSDLFQLQDQRRITWSADLDQSGVRDVLHSIYRPMHSQPIEAMRVTFSTDLLLFTSR